MQGLICRRFPRSENPGSLPDQRGTTTPPILCTRSSRRGQCAEARRRRPPPRRTVPPCRERLFPVNPNAWIGIQQPEEFHRPLALPQESRCQHHPSSGVCVLAAVLANSGNVSFDVARLQRYLCRTADRTTGSADRTRRTNRCWTAVMAWRARQRPRRRRSRPRIARSSRSGIRHWCAEPSGVPSSKYARRYH